MSVVTHSNPIVPRHISKMPKCPSKACICASVTVWVIWSVGVFILSCILYLKPYVRVSRYVRTSCRVESRFYTTQYICDCGYYCQATYPCLVVHVSVNDSKAREWVLTLYEDDHQQMNVVDKEPEEQEMCSVHKCVNDSRINRNVVDEFAQNYSQRGSLIACYYDPFSIRNGAVLTIIWPGWEVFHSVFWPFFAIVGGVIVCVIFCKRCRKEGLEADAKDSENAESRKTLTGNEEGGAKLETENKDTESKMTGKRGSIKSKVVGKSVKVKTKVADTAKKKQNSWI